MYYTRVGDLEESGVKVFQSTRLETDPGTADDSDTGYR